MQCYQRDESPFWVQVAISKTNASIETRTYRGKESLRLAAFCRDFSRAIIHATILGMGDGECEWRGIQVQGQCASTKGWINRSCYSCVPFASPTLP